MSGVGKNLLVGGLALLVVGCSTGVPTTPHPVPAPATPAPATPRPTPTPVPTPPDFSGQVVDGLEFDFTDHLIGADFSDATLVGVTFWNVDLSDATFAGAVLDGVRFEGSAADRVSFDGASSVAGYFSGTFEAASFEGASLDGAVFEGLLDSASFVEASLDGATFNHSSLVDASFASASLIGAVFGTEGGGRARPTTLTAASFDAADLTSAVFGFYAELEGSSFRGATLRGALFDGSVAWEEVDLTDAVIDGAVLEADWEIRDALAAACDGTPYPGAAEYAPEDSFRPMVFYGSGFFTDPPAEEEGPEAWYPPAAHYAQLVACTTLLDEIEGDTCRYTRVGQPGSFPITLHQKHVVVRVLAPVDGTVIAEREFTSEPLSGCPSTVSTFFDGSRDIDIELLIEFLAPFVGEPPS